MMRRSAVRRIGTWGIAAWIGAISPSLALAQVGELPPTIGSAIEAGTRDPSGRPGPRYWQLYPRYELRARLDTAAAVVLGTGTISLANPSPSPLTALVLRLDQNRFRLPDAPVKTAGIQLLNVSVDEADILGADERRANPDLRGTLLEIPLPRPLASGDSARIRMAWRLEVPLDEEGHNLRQGRWGESVFQIAQWYPRVAMYDDLHGWDRAEHDGSVEFHNPYADFEVSLSVPGGWLVGPTGTLENADEVLSARTRARLTAAHGRDTTMFVVGRGERGAVRTSSDGFLTWRFRAGSVSDFAWGTSSEFAWAVDSRTHADGRRVLVHALTTPRSETSLVRAAAEANAILADLSDRVVTYAWGHHTLLDGPETGMEYPMLTMSNGEALRHELGHQWFPMMVGSDETRFAFMDEGIASYLAGVLDGSETRSREEPATSEPIILHRDIRSPRPMASLYGYGRGARMLSALAQVVGHDRVLRGLRDYATEWRFRHPSPWDFMASMERSLGADLTELWQLWLFETTAIESSGR